MTLQCTEDKWNKILDVNLKAPYYLAQMVVPEMLKRGGGNIINLGSVTGVHPIPVRHSISNFKTVLKFTILQLLGPYGVSKAALLFLTKVLSSELAPQNIRVNMIAPGLIDTAFASKVS